MERLPKLILLTTLLACWIALALESSASAAGLLIGFDLSESRFGLLGGQIEVPRDGEVLPGSRLAIEVDADPTGGPLPGAASLIELSFTASFDAELFGGALELSGRVEATQLGHAAGLLDGSLDLLNVTDVALELTLSTLCTGPSCELLGLETMTRTVQTTVPDVLFELTNLEQDGLATIATEREFELNGLVFQLELIGAETQRAAALPEPSTVWLLGLLISPMFFRQLMFDEAKATPKALHEGG